MKKYNLYVIEASTGCSCCSYQNHYRGPYKTKGDAERRIKYYKAKNSKYWPLASQYAHRGRYSIEKITVEEIDEDRSIVGSLIMQNYKLYPVEVDEKGRVSDNDAEWFCEDTYKLFGDD